MAKIEPANLLLVDKDGNRAIVKSLTDNDLNKLSVGLSDVSDLKTRVKAVEDNGYVSYNSVQTLNEEQCSQAQANMDAPGLSANNTFIGNMTVEANVKADSMTLNTSSDYAKLSASTNDHGIKLLGGSSDTTGASIDLRGSTDINAPNTFTVSASNSVALTGSKTGSLTWNSENVVRKVNNLSADASGNVLLGTEKSTFNKVVYDTGYFSIATDKTYSFDLTGSDLENVPKDNVNIRLVAKVITAVGGFEIGDIAQITPSLDYTYSYDDLDICAYIHGNTFYIRSCGDPRLSINNGTSYLKKDNVQIKAVLTAFIPDDGSILLIAEDQTNTSKLIGIPDGTLTWRDKNLVRSIDGVNADASGNATIKNMSIAWSMPDWSSVIDITSHFTTANGSFTTPSDGYIQVLNVGDNRAYIYNKPNMASSTTDNAFIHMDGSNGDGILVYAFVPISKGQTIYQTSSGGLNQGSNKARINFIPCKGAN